MGRYSPTWFKVGTDGGGYRSGQEGRYSPTWFKVSTGNGGYRSGQEGRYSPTWINGKVVCRYSFEFWWDVRYVRPNPGRVAINN